MQTSVVILLACLVAVAYSKSLQSPAVDALDMRDDLTSIHETEFDATAHERSPRNKRGLLLLKKKLLLGALGLKAAKVTAVGGAVAGAALAAKKIPAKKYVVLDSGAHHSYGYSSHGPAWNVEVHSWH